MRSISARFDARLWGFIIVGALSIATPQPDLSVAAALVDPTSP